MIFRLKAWRSSSDLRSETIGIFIGNNFNTTSTSNSNIRREIAYIKANHCLDESRLSTKINHSIELTMFTVPKGEYMWNEILCKRKEREHELSINTAEDDEEVKSLPRTVVKMKKNFLDRSRMSIFVLYIMVLYGLDDIPFVISIVIDCPLVKVIDQTERIFLIINSCSTSFVANDICHSLANCIVRDFSLLLRFSRSSLSSR